MAELEKWNFQALWNQRMVSLRHWTQSFLKYSVQDFGFALIGTVHWFFLLLKWFHCAALAVQ